VDQAKVLHDSLNQFVHRQGDVFVGSNVTVDLADGGPPLVAKHLVALGTATHERATWLVADEGPPEIVLLEDATTVELERWAKIGVSEVFIFDPKARAIIGYWLTPAGFARITPEDDGRVASEELRLVLAFVDTAAGPILRWFKRDGTMLETPTETEAVRRARIAKMIEQRDREVDQELKGF